MDIGRQLRRSATTKVLTSRVSRLGILFVLWLIVREASLRTGGFEDGPVVCPIRLLTGYPCPGCGGTRAIGAICVGQFERAWSLNPVTFVLCFMVIAWAAQITPLNKLARRVLTIFQSRAIFIQVLVLISLYGIAWIAAIGRFNSGIL